MKATTLIRLFSFLLIVSPFMWGCASKNKEAGKTGSQGYFDKATSATESTEEAVDESESSLHFSMDELSEDDLSAFDIRGMQKVQDFSDLVTIITDPELDASFRNKAREMCDELFVSGKSPIRLPGFQSRNARLVIDSLEVFPYPLSVKIDSIWIIKGLSTHKPQGNYSGSLGFKCIWKDDFSTTHYEGRATLLAEKLTKNFGAESKEIWEVRLERVILNF